MSTDAGGTGTAGWHADPAGRFEHRWWDGAAWTDDVATGGAASKDPLEPAADPASPTAPGQATPGSMLDAASFAIDFTDGGMGGHGTWGVLDPNGAYLGRMIIKRRRIGSFDDRFVVEDAQGRLLYQLESQTAGNDLILRDAANQVVGLLDVTNEGLTLLASGLDPASGPARWGTVRVQGMGGWVGPGTGIDPTAADVISITGQQVGQIRIVEHRSGPFGGGPRGQCWFHVDRDPAMPDPMRALVLVAPIGITCAVEGARYRLRRHRT